MTESEFQDQQANVLMRQKQWETRYNTGKPLPPYEDGPLTVTHLMGGPWDWFDRAIGWALNLFAAIGVSVTIGLLVGLMWGYFK